MPTSEVDICCLALSHLGDEAMVTSIVPPDGTVQAAHCKRFYPFARDLLLEAHPWTFATRRVALAVTDNPSPFDWSFAYELPADCIRPLSALLPGTPEIYYGTETDAGSHPYLVETDADGDKVLFTNVETAVLRYIAVTTDTSKYTPGFTLSLSRLLAAYLAGPIIKGSEGMQVSQAQLKWFDIEYRKAAAADANTGKRNTFTTRLPSHIAARGGFRLQ